MHHSFLCLFAVCMSLCIPGVQPNSWTFPYFHAFCPIPFFLLCVFENFLYSLDIGLFSDTHLANVFFYSAALLFVLLHQLLQGNFCRFVEVKCVNFVSSGICFYSWILCLAVIQNTMKVKSVTSLIMTMSLITILLLHSLLLRLCIALIQVSPSQSFLTVPMSLLFWVSFHSNFSHSALYQYVSYEKKKLVKKVGEYL